VRRLYPVFLDVAGRKAVVIGGGAVAGRKAASLAEAGAELTVISPEVEPALTALVNGGKALHIKRAYTKGDLKGAFIAVAATDDPEVNRLVSEEAVGLGILVNCASPPSSGNFFVPSSIHKGGLTVAISTGGACPALTKKLRIRLSETIGDEYGPLLEFLEEARAKLKEELPSEPDRASALEELADSGLLEYFRDKPALEARRSGEDLLQAAIVKRKDRV
jgi:precorrin-2 dehydrogenase/sirohydrochlorin ferrochelatase